MRRAITPRRLQLRPATIRILAEEQLRSAAGGLRATGDQCASVDPCPGDYSWFCVP